MRSISAMAFIQTWRAPQSSPITSGAYSNRRWRSSDHVINLREVSKTVVSGTEPLIILHPLSLDIPGGRFVAIVGPSGSGKSTLLGLIAGLDAPSSGSVLIDEVDITKLGEDDLA